MANPNNPRLYRWQTPDPLGGNVADPQSLNRYAYVLNNPINFTDPLGLFTAEPYQEPCSAANWMSNARCRNVPTFWVWWESGFYPYRDEDQIVEGGGGQSSQSPTPANNTTPQQAATTYCQDHGQISFNIPFTEIPFTISLSATLLLNFSTTNDVSVTYPPSAGLSLDVTVGAPNGPSIPVQVGAGRNASVGTFLTPQGPRGFSLSVPLGPVAGSPVTVSPTVFNACGLRGGGG